MLLVENEIVQEASIRDKLSMFFTYSIEIIYYWNVLSGSWFSQFCFLQTKRGEFRLRAEFTTKNFTAAASCSDYAR